MNWLSLRLRSLQSLARRRVPGRRARCFCRTTEHVPDGEPVTAEALERRRMLSFSTSLSNGVLTVLGDGNSQEIIVWRSSGDIKVREVLNQVETDSTGYASSSVTRIDVYAGYGDDLVTIETDTDNPIGTTGIDQPTRLYGDNGNDTLKGGDAADILYGQMGNDELHGGGGDDSLYGGYGGPNDADTNGTDTLIGDAGADFMDGGPGSNDSGNRDANDEYTNIENWF